MSKMMVPKESIAEVWRETHGGDDWEGLLDPLCSLLGREIKKYGEFAQATYDAFKLFQNCGNCRHRSPNRLLEDLGLGSNGYTVTKYIYMLGFLELSCHDNPCSRNSNWMGFVAVSKDDETRRIGRRDIVVAWRGTKTHSEWFTNIKRKMDPSGDQGDENVEHGFLSIYKLNSDPSRFNQLSASEQVMGEVIKLVSSYRGKGEQASFTITGHSLGGALALLNAHDVASSVPDIHVSVISFGAPRVGNTAFRDKLTKMRVKTLRVVAKHDWVPQFPGIIFNKVYKFPTSCPVLNRVFAEDDKLHLRGMVNEHVRVQLELKTGSSNHRVKQVLDPKVHKMKTYMHLIDGFFSNAET